MNEGRNPWTVLSKRVAYENPWIRVDHHEVLHAAGGPGIYGTVHFKAHATGVVPIDDHGNVILVGQHRFPLNSYSWEIPEGGCTEDGSVLHAAQRELLEECGLTARNWLEILQTDLSNSVSDERGTLFLAWDLAQVPAEPEPTEELQVTRVPFWDAVRRVKGGKIRDGTSVAGLLRVALMAAEGELPPELAATLCRR